MAMIFFLFALVLSPAAHAFEMSATGDIVGRASVIDADTLDFMGQRVRLSGVDAPETRQECLDASGAPWRCGQRAALALSDFIGASPVTCVAQGSDKYSRTLAICSVRGVNINAWLVRHGLAVAYRRYSTQFAPEEDAARAERVGIWAGDFETPETWRHNKRKGGLW